METINDTERQWASLTKRARVIYTAVFLPHSESLKLLKEVPPKHDTVYAHHLTLGFGSGVSLDLPWGEEVTLKGVREFSDEKGQALEVQSTGIQGKSHPHITISMKTGVPPKYSNELLSHGGGEPVSITLKGRVGWWDGQKAVFEPPT